MSAANPNKKKIVYKDRIVSHDDGEGNWLVSYADMMTLLFGFFVIVSAFSKPDTEKLEKLKKETSKSMGVKYEKPNEALSNSLEVVLKSLNLEKEVEIKNTDEGISIISKGTLFFDSGSTDLKPQANELMSKISDSLANSAKNFKVVVEGHTDDAPIVSDRFPSNWELSASRASTVVRLMESKGFPHEQLRPSGLADTEPVAENLNPDNTPNIDGRAQNRRIVIRVLKQLPERMKPSIKK